MMRDASIDLEWSQARAPRESSLWRKARGFIGRQPHASLCAAILILMGFVVVLPGVFAPYDPEVNNVGPSLVGPSSSHWFGTDQFGRDVLSRILYGSRLSFAVGILSTILSMVIATVLGIVSARFPGIVDDLIGRIVDVVQSIPALILLAGFVVAVGPSLTSVVLVIGISTGISGSRLIRSSALQTSAMAFVEAAESLGAGNLRVMIRHILPNVVPVILVVASSRIGAAILVESSLSFLGYGVPPPAPTLGGMLGADGRIFMVINPAMFFAPLLVLATIVYTVNVLGDALRDELDPRLRSRG